MENIEDYTAAKLKGHNCVIKFLDGEILFLRVNEIANGPEGDDSLEWFADVENFLNGTNQNFPLAGISIARTSVKYVKHI